MHKPMFVGGALCVMVLSAACGSSEAEKQAQQTVKALEEAGKSAAPAAEQAAKGLEAMAKGLQGLGAAPGDGKPTEPVSFRELQTIFADVDGWQKGKPTGERMTSPVSFSQAEVRYTSGEARIKVKVVDSGLNPLLLMPYSIFLASGYEKETDEGYEKSTPVAGHPGWEKWNGERKNGEVNALVAKRFVVSIEGNDIADTKALHALAAKMDLAKLASMAK